MIELERFVADCLAAQAADRSFQLVQDAVARMVADPPQLLRCLGEPERPAMQKLYHAPGLTILNVIFAPGMTIPPHDHHMRAAIGIYTGREDNIFWQRPGADGRLEAIGARALRSRDAALLDADIIHSVANPLTRLTGAIHVYDGDFFAAERSEWDPETLLEQAFDAERAIARFQGG